MLRLALVLSGIIALFAAAACSGDGSSSASAEPPPSSGVRIAGTRTAGASGDALALSLLRSTDPDAGAVFRMPDRELADEMRFHADAHVESAAFASGSGPGIEGSPRIRRLAAEPTAPVDANGNGTNLDETFAADLTTLAQLAGGAATPQVQSALFSWQDASAELASGPGAAARGEYASYRTRPAVAGVVDTEQIGHAMRLRLAAATELLDSTTGALGETSERGVRGLVLLQQAVAMEESLVKELFHDGMVMGRVRDPENYDPRTAPPQWIPRLVRAIEGTELPGIADGYTVEDPASSLSSLSVLLGAANELTRLASGTAPRPQVRDLLRGPTLGPEPTPGGPVTINWDDDVRGILFNRCRSCHSPPFPRSAFDATNYNLVLRGGQSRFQGFRSVVKGDHTQSLLWQILVRNTPVGRRMPAGGSRLPAAQIQLIADWIDGGAPKAGAPIPRRIGIDLTRVLLQNLLHLHMDPTTGALDDRHEGDAPSGIATPRSTGEALVALSEYVTRVGDDVEARSALELAATWAAQWMRTPTGDVHGYVDIASGTPAGGAADLLGHARLTAGLLSAAQVTGRSDLAEAGRRLARTLLRDFYDDSTGLFRSRVQQAGIRYSPLELAAVLDALRETATAFGPCTAVEGHGARELHCARRAIAVHDRFLATLRPWLVFAEWDGRGEVLGDGIADTDGNGIPEPALAGGPGRAPMFVGEIRVGPEPGSEAGAQEITWSTHIQPLFRGKCASCHFDGADLGSYRMDTPTLLSTPGESGGQMPLVVPGQPEMSLLYRKIADRVPPVGVQMPQAKPPMDARALALVHQWISEGATRR